MTIRYKDQDFEIEIYDDQLLAAIKENGVPAMKETVKFIRDETVRLMKESVPVGKIYFRRRQSKSALEGRTRMPKTKKKGWSALGDYIMHQASAPGQPPAPDSGHLWQSFTFDAKVDKEGILGQVGTNVPYDDPLEFGSVKMEPRPHWRPAIMNNQEKIMEKFATRLLPEDNVG